MHQLQYSSVSILSCAWFAGKYTSSNRPTGQRSVSVSESRIREAQPLLDLMKVIADGQGKTMAQVGHAMPDIV
jgi:aryl-alcohol dehydrogenase-like predicted oxidoreductase